MAELTDKVIILTGASQGIGRAVAQRLDQDGAKLFLVARSEQKLQQTRDLLQGDHEIFPLDVAQRNRYDELISTVTSKHGRLDGLVNNAGVMKNLPVRRAGEEDYDRIMDINLKSSFFLAQKAGEAMIKNKSGHIIFISSYYGQRGQPLNSIYAMTKAAQISLTKSLALEWAKFNIRVNSICPGMVDTEMMADVKKSERMYKAFVDSVPLKRMGEPEEIAEAVAFLMSDKTGYISGSKIEINGGLSATL